MSTDVTTSKKAWDVYVVETRDQIWKDYEKKDTDLANVILYLREDPSQVPVKKLSPRAVHVFVGDFYDGPDAAVSIEQFKEAWSRMIRLTAIAGLGIATVIYQKVWLIELDKDDDSPLPDNFADHPDAQKYLFFRTEHLEYGVKCWLSLITQDGDNRCLGPWEETPGTQGRLFSFLPHDTPPAATRLLAHKLLLQLADTKERGDAT